MFFGDGSGAGAVGREAAGYDVSTGTWRTLAAAPAAISPGASAVAADDRVYVWLPGGRRLTYDPSADSWERIPALPELILGADTVWTGSEWLVVGSGRSHRELAVAAYGPTARAWRVVDVPLPVAASYEGNRGSQAAVWTGDRVLIYTGALGSGLTDDGTAVLSLDPSTDRWERLPDAPASYYDPPLLWTGTHAILYGDPTFRLPPPDPKAP